MPLLGQVNHALVERLQLHRGVRLVLDFIMLGLLAFDLFQDFR